MGGVEQDEQTSKGGERDDRRDGGIAGIAGRGVFPSVRYGWQMEGVVCVSFLFIFILFISSSSSTNAPIMLPDLQDAVLALSIEDRRGKHPRHRTRGSLLVRPRDGAPLVTAEARYVTAHRQFDNGLARARHSTWLPPRSPTLQRSLPSMLAYRR